MLPNSNSSSSSIHINPKFRNVHINPNFLNKSNGVNNQTATVTVEPKAAIAPTQIYINPLFLNTCDSITSTQSTKSTSRMVHAKENLAHIPSGYETFETMAIIVEPLADTKIHTRTKIFHNPIKPKVTVATKTPTVVNSIDNSMKSLIKIGSKKLVRVSAKPFTKSPKVRRPLQTKYKIIKEQTAFKIDRRSAMAKLAAITRNIVPLVSSRKFWINESLMPSKTTASNLSPSLSKQTALSPESTRLKGSTLLNINGILYKSNRRKLEKTTISSPYSIKKPKTLTTKSKPYRRLIVRGENFLLDASGKNLIRVQTNENQSNSNTKQMDTNAVIIKRIDIGKITFVKKSNDTFERTDFHKSRYHLNVAKLRSIQTLTNRMVKMNVPCPIYRKLGKCAAYVRGKCAKLHDKKLVDVCPRFLRGVCDRNPCLLSHDLTLSKMPTCKFYLQGMCFKSDCPYLHKKVNDRTEICVDFLRGFCGKADQCTKRHEFLCPEQQSKGSCKLTRCPYSHRMSNIQIEQSHIKKPESVKIKRKLKNAKTEHKKVMKSMNTMIINRNVETAEKLNTKRYFDDDKSQKPNRNDSSELIQNSESENQPDSMTSTDNVEHIIVVRKPNVGSLPSFIPIG